MRYLIIIFFYASALFSQAWVGEIKTIEGDYNISFLFSKVADSWNSVDYKTLSSEEKNVYMPIVVFALKEYPKNYFKKIGLEKFVIGRNVSFEKTLRAAIPDNSKKTIFLSYVPSYKEAYIVHCIHHEINHFAEFYLWGSYRYDWDKWRKLFNKKHASGGEVAYTKPNVDWYTFDKNLSGFANKYSTLGQEEDRSEIIGFFLNGKEKERLLVIEKAKKDKLFFEKCELLFNLYSQNLSFPNLLTMWKSYF